MNQATHGYGKTHQMGGNPRKTEAYALTECARRLSLSVEQNDQDHMLSALRLNLKLWTIFADELVDEDHPMPVEIRQNILSLAAFVDKQTTQFIFDQDPAMLNVLIEINRNIAAGLLQEPDGADIPAEQTGQTMENNAPPPSVAAST